LAARRQRLLRWGCCWPIRPIDAVDLLDLRRRLVRPQPCRAVVRRVPLPGGACPAGHAAGRRAHRTLAWLANFLARDPKPACFTRNWPTTCCSAGDLWRLGPGVDGSRSSLRLHLSHVFILQGIFACSSSSKARCFCRQRDTPGGALLWLYVFVVYGSAMGLAVLLWRPGCWPRIDGGDGCVSRWSFAQLRFHGNHRSGWGLLLKPLPVPEPRPIWEAPLCERGRALPPRVDLRSARLCARCFRLQRSGCDRSARSVCRQSLL